MDPILILSALAIIALTALTLPAVRYQKSWKGVPVILLRSVFGILLPAFFFLASVALAPDCKKSCRFGWLDCFHEGKLALTPLVLWASLALYALEICRVKNRNQLWIVLGFFVGAIVSGVCVLSGIMCLDWSEGGVAYLFMVVPVYTAVWYCLRAVQLAQSSKLSLTPYVIVLCLSLPFWGASAVWSYLKYIRLPENSPDCFMVPAARPHFAGLPANSALDSGYAWATIDSMYPASPIPRG